MLIALLKFLDPLVVLCFELHDFASSFIAKNFLVIKRGMLVVAYLSLLWILFPETRRSFGNAAEAMLLFILFLSPISKIFRMRLLFQAMGLRRELGILMGCFALVHGAAYFIDPASFSFDIAPYLNTHFFSMQPLFYFGIFSLALTVPLLLTSNNLSQRVLGGRRWKILHRIVYVLLLVVLLHVLFLRSMRGGYSVIEWIPPISIILGYILLKVLAWKNFLPFLRDGIADVSARYTAFALAKKARTPLQAP
ncbi:MAG: ferric reductase-like transmembrane domain-containing protein [Candidatus Moraniibacteriota bacterium]